MSRPLLIVGAKGQLGRELCGEASRRALDTLAVGRDELDITDADAVRRFVGDAAPRAIINAAAYTAVDKAESDGEAAHAINALGPEHLARAAAELDIPLLHVSTDYVFDGTKHGAYCEDDAGRAARGVRHAPRKKASAGCVRLTPNTSFCARLGFTACTATIS